MAQGQDWCLHCGAGAPGSLRSSGGLGPIAAIIGVSVVLVLGAAAAAYAALKGSPHKVVKTVATTSVPTTSVPTSPVPTIPSSGESSTSTSPPKIPLSTPTPESQSGSNEEANNALFPPEKTKSSKSKTTPSSKTKGEKSKTPAEGNGSETQPNSGEEQQKAIELDTNAASTYNPYGYPESSFGDPSMAIDGDPTTTWTAEVQPASAPLMAVGLLIDLKSSQSVAQLGLEGSTVGMSVQVYGARGTEPPPSITKPAWIQLHSSQVTKKSKVKIKLHEPKKAFRYILLWITKAPASSIGTQTEPGNISVGEVKLYPPA